MRINFIFLWESGNNFFRQAIAARSAVYHFFFFASNKLALVEHGGGLFDALKIKS